MHTFSTHTGEPSDQHPQIPAGIMEPPSPATLEPYTAETEKQASPVASAPVVPPQQARTLMRQFLTFFDFTLIWIAAAAVYGLSALFIHLFGRSAPLEPWTRSTCGFLLLFAVLLVLITRIYGLYDSPWKTNVKGDLILLAKAVTYSTVIAGACTGLWNISISLQSFLIPTIAASWLLLAGWRKFVRTQSIAGLSETRNVLIVGCGPSGEGLRHHLRLHPDLGYVFKGYVDRRKTGRPPDPARNSEEAFVLGPIKALPSICRAHFVDEIFIAIPGDDGLVAEIAHYGRQSGVHVRVIPENFQGLASEVPIEYVGPCPTLTLYEAPIPSIQLIVKRVFDLVISAALLLLCLPLLLLLAVIVKLDSEGPVLYGSLRVGKKGHTFVCYKFRTMVKNAEALKEKLSHLNERDGILFKINADPRLTRVGGYLRRFSLDELPQLWNVLKGEMSLVGPRPPVPVEYNQYAIDHLRRLAVTPGVTGLWQVKARRDPSFDSYIALDREYVNNWSLWLDCQILLKTIGVVVAGTGQ